MRFIPYTIFSCLLLLLVACKNDPSNTNANQATSVEEQISQAEISKVATADSFALVETKMSSLKNDLKAISAEQRKQVKTKFNFEELESYIASLEKDRSEIIKEQKEIDSRFERLTAEYEKGNVAKEEMDGLVKTCHKQGLENVEKLQAIQLSLDEARILFEELTGKRPIQNIQ